MLIVSWNVAGLKPALQKIHSDYGSSSSSVAAASSASSTKSKSEIGASTAKKKDSLDPFANYIRLHGDVDILCLQEHKIPLTQLSSRSEPHRCSSIEGHESFWSCATDKAVKGFNGVCTYAKVGLVQSANSTPFGDPELDNQGRCIMTDHGKFVVFNVYVPCSGVKTPMPEKMKFLNALSDAMDKQRQNGKHVILVGDMNLKSNKRDVQWGHRSLNVDEILEQMKQQQQNDDKEDESVPKWKIDLANNWNKIEQVLETKEAIPRQTTNPSTKEKFNRFKVRVKVGDNQYEELGSNEDSAEEALCYYTFDEGSYVDPDTDGTIVCRKKNRLCIVTLVELMQKIANVKWNVETQRQVAEEAGLNPDHPPTRWVRGLMEGNNGMVDVFRHFYPTAEARFTVWHQFQQKRYTNEGTRIDFTLVDQPLMEHVHPNDGKTLRCGKEPHSDPLGEEAAFNAATAGGLFEGGSYGGGGISTATQRALDTQFGEYSHTGMIYTPPSYSDHIAVSLLMKSTFREYTGQLTLGNDSNTKKAQPHKKQRSISSFFSASSKSSSSISSKTTTSKKATGMKRSASTQAEKEKEKKKSMYSFFGNNTNKTKENDGNKDTTAEAASAKAASTKDVPNKKGASSKEEDEEKKKSMYSFFGNNKTKEIDGNKDTKDVPNKKEASSKEESSLFDC